MGKDSKREREPFQVKLRATRVVVRPTGKKRLDGSQTTVPSLAQAGDVASYNGDSYAIQMYAIGGALVPVDRKGKEWLAAVKVSAEAADGATV